MSTLSDGTIRNCIKSGDLRIDPLPADEQYQPASLDVRLSEEFLVPSLPNEHPPAVEFVVDPKKGRMPRWEELESPDGIVLEPNEFVLGSTVERIGLPDDVVARVEGRSSLGRLGILVHATAGFIDPGFEGRVTLEIYNLLSFPVLLRPGGRVAQVVFQTIDQPVERPYGEALGSKYQNQQGPVESRLDEEST